MGGKPQKVHQFVVHSGVLLLRKRGKLCLGKLAAQRAAALKAA